MTGYLLTFTASVRSRPDVPDVRPYLARGLRALRAHPDIADAICRHNGRTHTVTFHVVPSHTFAPDYAVISAHRALHEALRRAGIWTQQSPAGRPLPPVQVRIGTWPDAIRAG